MLTQLREALADKYEIDRELGAGGMGCVYLARDKTLSRQVALKVVRPEVVAEINVERFRREIQIAAKLRHPHIVPLLTAGEAGGVLYYTMPLVEGESLRQVLQRSGPMPADKALQLALEVADALAYAHEQGVIHRDIKPENILVDSGHAVVTDFGIARAVQEAESGTLTRTGVLIGTPQYMSPEQFAASPVDARSDVFSLACVLYELLTGKPPSIAGTPSSGTSRLPNEIGAALSKALAANPDERHAGAAELRADLKRLLALQQSAAPRVVRGRPFIALATLGGIGAVVVATLLIKSRDSRNTDVRPTPSAQPKVTIDYAEKPLKEVIDAFMAFSGRSFILSPRVNGEVKVRAQFNNVPWDVALQQLLLANGLNGLENESGVILIDTKHAIETMADSGPITTRSIRLLHTPVADGERLVRPFLSPRGRLLTDTVLNVLIVSDNPARLDGATRFLLTLDSARGTVARRP